MEAKQGREARKDEALPEGTTEAFLLPALVFFGGGEGREGGREGEGLVGVELLESVFFGCCFLEVFFPLGEQSLHPSLDVGLLDVLD